MDYEVAAIGRNELVVSQLFGFKRTFCRMVSDLSGGVGLECGMKRGISRMAKVAWGLKSAARRDAPATGHW